MQSSDLKTVLGTLRFARVPRTVFEVLGLHLSQDPSEKGGVLAQVIFMDKCLSFHRRGFVPASCKAFRATKTHFLILQILSESVVVFQDHSVQRSAKRRDLLLSYPAFD